MRSGFAIKPLCGLLLALALLGALPALCAANMARADERAPSEHEVKAAFLYNFAKFVEWPADTFKEPGAPFVLCIAGAEAYVSARDMLSAKNIKGRRLSVRQVKPTEPVHDCHLLFVSRAEADHAQAILDAADAHALRVGEASDFIRRGGVINLVRHANKFRFEINRSAGERSGFQFNYQLLQLATLVEP